MKTVLRKVMRGAIRSVRRIKWVRRLMDEEANQFSLRSMRLDSVDILEGRWWEELDTIYTLCRRLLRANPDWRQYPCRVRDVAMKGYAMLHKSVDFEEKSFVDFGCGTHHPYAMAAVMYLQGASSCLALDRNDADPKRSAEALGDLVCDWICFPGKWNWRGVSEDAYMKRVKQFNLEALLNGHLEEGLAGVPLRHLVHDMMNDVPLPDGSADVLASWDVLEHVTNMQTTMNRLYAMMRPGGVAYHAIDLTDHRIHWNPNVHKWSFLANTDDFSDSGCSNRLRWCEIRPSIERAGFKIIMCKKQIEPIPEGVKAQFIERFQSMPDEELNIVGVECVLQKP